MSGDMVDDLHAAEDFAETIRVRARAVIDAFVETAKYDPTSANGAFAWGTFQVCLGDLDTVSSERFVRPGCAPEDEDRGMDSAPCVEGEDCGGYHPWARDD